ncbi:MAG: SAM-dependent methyltransferase [Acidobacteria bacterium]|nr:SAM-dependent methyltransferase [Acidobacteriota bacterium]
MTRLGELLRQRIRRDGPLPFAAFAECALYHPDLGYYARAERRSGRDGDFFTSVDLGPLFGELLAVQLAEMWRVLGGDSDRGGRFALVEAAAGSGRLARDVLDSAAERDPAFYDAVDLHLVERSRAARDAQTRTLGPHAARIASSGPEVPSGVTGVVFANELLDALPPHVLVMTDDGLREVYVDVDARRDGLVERLGPLSDAAVGAHVASCGIRLEPGWRAEVCPAAVAWVRRAARALRRGFLLLIDYGHEAQELYSATHAAGTLTTFRRHRVRNEAAGGTPPWLADPGERDITAHVDLTAVRRTAEREGLRTIGVLDQTYFLLGLGALDLVAADDGVAGLRRRLALKSLLVPGGLGSTHKVLVFGKGVGAARLAGCAHAARVT